MKQNKMVKGGLRTLFIFGAFLALFTSFACGNKPKPKTEGTDTKVDATITKVMMGSAEATKSGKNFMIELDAAPTKDIAIGDVKVKAQGKDIKEKDMVTKEVKPKKAGTDKLMPGKGESTTLLVTVTDKDGKLKDATFELTVKVKSENTPPPGPAGEKEPAVVTKVVAFSQTWTGNATAATDKPKLTLQTPPSKNIEAGDLTTVEARSTKANSTIKGVTMKVKSVTKKSGNSLKPAAGEKVVLTVVAEDKNTTAKLKDITFELEIEVKAAEEAPKLATLKIKQKKTNGVDVLSLNAEALKAADSTGKDATFAGLKLELPYAKASGEALIFEATTVPAADVTVTCVPADLTSTGHTFTTTDTAVTVTLRKGDKTTVYKAEVAVTAGTIADATEVKLGDVYKLTTENLTEAKKDTGFEFDFLFDQAALDISAKFADGVTVTYNLDVSAANGGTFGDAKNFTPMTDEKTVKIKASKTDCPDVIYTLKLKKVAAPEKHQLGWIKIGEKKLCVNGMKAAATDAGLPFTCKAADLASISWVYNTEASKEPTAVKVCHKKNGEQAFCQTTDCKTPKAYTSCSGLTAADSPLEVKIEVEGDNSEKTVYLLKITIEA